MRYFRPGMDGIRGMQERTFPGTISYSPNYSQILNDLFESLQSPTNRRFFEIQSPGDYLSFWLIRDLLEILGLNLSNLRRSSLLPKPEQTLHFIRFNLMFSNARKPKEELEFLVKGELITESQNILQEDSSSSSNRNNHLLLDNSLLKQFWGQSRFPQPGELAEQMFWTFRVAHSVKPKHILAYQPFFQKLQTHLSLLPNLYVIVFAETSLPLNYDHKYQLQDFNRTGIIQLLQSWCATYLFPDVWEENAIVRLVDYIRVHCTWGHLDVSMNTLLRLIGLLRREQQYLTPEVVDNFLPQISLPYLRSESED